MSVEHPAASTVAEIRHAVFVNPTLRTDHVLAFDALVKREADARDLLDAAWKAICFERQPDDEKAVAENRLLAQIEGWLRGG